MRCFCSQQVRTERYVDLCVIFAPARLRATVNAAFIARLLGSSGKEGIWAATVLVPHLLALFLTGGITVGDVDDSGDGRFDVPTLSGVTRWRSR